ncbi:hypothetical protein GCM10009547_43240 [Sporichthya brevicatena]|uniref:ABC transporter domain-containing protein n=1 Tax=Sporichthya brevicatena TaxID=171442 RepID=A0ABN1H9Y5_9ACTN
MSAVHARVEGLEARNLVMRFGGLVAVDGMSLQAPRGRLTGLIGPNGAGKTTTFNMCSGLARPTSGTVLFDGSDVTHEPPHARALRGLGRTFQRMELFDSLTVRENLDLGREAGLAGGSPWRLVVSRPRDAADIRRRTERAAEVCGIVDLLDRVPADLSTGQRRLVELARVVAGEFSVLLLDEPSSGLDGRETTEFGAILRRLIVERSLGILLVEHDMALVMSVCDYLYVLDFGRPIFEGTPAEVAASDVVRAAYLGADGAADALEVLA